MNDGYKGYRLNKKFLHVKIRFKYKLALFQFMKEQKDKINLDDESEQFITTDIAVFRKRFIFILIVIALLIAPTYPTTMSAYSWDLDGRDPSQESFDLQSPLFVLINGFEWNANPMFFGSWDGGVSVHQSASPYPMIVYLAFIFIIGIWLLARQRKGLEFTGFLDETKLIIIFWGFLIFLLGIILSIGIFMSMAIGFVRWPIDGIDELKITFMVIAPALLIISLYFLRERNNLNVKRKYDNEITLKEGKFPSWFSIVIVVKGYPQSFFF